MRDSSPILVTGGCGYIGSHVTRHLSENAYRVVVLDNLSTGKAEALLHNETLITDDLNHEDILEKLFETYQFESVIHFAAAIVAPESVSNPVKYYENNTKATLNLLKAASRFGVKNFIISSTAAIYGNPVKTLVSESDPTLPANPYGKSKLMCEWMLEDIAKVSNLNFVTLRYFNAAGADFKGQLGQRVPNATHLIKVVCETALGLRKEIVVHGNDYPTKDGTGVRDYIHVEDLASAHLAGLRYLEKGGKSVTLNCGYGHGYSVLEVIHEMEKILGRKLAMRYGPRRPGDVGEVIADTNKIRKTLNWAPKHDNLKEILQSALAWETKMVHENDSGPIPKGDGSGEISRPAMA